jgi:hypothetical protein
VTISLKPEQKPIIHADIARGRFRSPDEVLDHALAALKQLSRKPAAPRKNLAQFLMESPLAGAELNLLQSYTTGGDVHESDRALGRD